MFKLLHIPTALYVAACPRPADADDLIAYLKSNSFYCISICSGSSVIWLWSDEETEMLMPELVSDLKPIHIEEFELVELDSN